MNEPIDLTAALDVAVAEVARVRPPHPHPETADDVFRKVEREARPREGWYRRQAAALAGMEWCDVCEEPGDKAEMHDCGLHHTGCLVACDVCGDDLPPCELRDRCGCCDRRVCRECSCGCTAGCFL